MLKSFLQLNINTPHNKSQYSIKKNKLILLANGGLNSTMMSRTSKTEDHVVSRCINQNPSRFGTGTKSRFSATRITQDGINNSKCIDSSTSLMPNEVKFDCITYDYKSTNQKLLYDFLMLKPSQNKLTSLMDIDFSAINKNIPSQDSISASSESQPVSMTITFNYDIQYEKIQELFIQLMQIKKFQQSQFKIAHFQLRNNHISDYNKSIASSNQLKKKKQKSPDQMEIFTKEIDTCIKLDKTWKIMQNINFKHFNLKNYKQKDIMNKNSRTNYDKKTNEFFICDIDDGKYELNIIVLHRQKDYVLTKSEDKQIEQAFILQKNTSSNQQNQKIILQFTTSLVQIIQSYLINSDEVIFVSQYPTLNNSSSLSQLLRIPIKIDEFRPEQVQKIIQTYNKQKETKLQTEMQKMKSKLRQITCKRKTTQQNIAYLMKKYKKGFQNIFDSLTYLKSHNITDLGAFKANLENQIKEKEQEIKETLQNLKEINYEIITAQERNEYFKQKMEILKENLQQDLEEIDCGIGNNTKPSSTTHSSGKSPKPEQVGKKSPSQSKNDHELTETILNKFLEVEQQSENPFTVQMQRQVQKYTNQLRQKTRERLIKSRQVEQFHNLMDELRKKLSKQQFTKLQQKYLGLISMC